MRYIKSRHRIQFQFKPNAASGIESAVKEGPAKPAAGARAQNGHLGSVWGVEVSN